METFKKQVFLDKDLSVKVEQAGGFLFLHCEVFHYDKEVKKKMEVVFYSIVDACLYFGWDRLWAYTPNPKFAKMFGKPEFVDMVEADGQQVEVLVWELSQQ